MDWTQVLTVFAVTKITAIHSEIKDFHGKMCAIEERNKGK